MVHLDNDLRFMANFRYELKGNVTKGQHPSAFSSPKLEAALKGNNQETSSKFNFNSICDKTMIGFVHDTKKNSSLAEHEVTCFYAEKDRTRLYEDQVQLQQSEQTNLGKVNEALVQSKSEARVLKKPAGRRRGKKPNLFHTHKPTPEKDSYISWIN
jgi:hypothetical protein